MNSEDGQVYSVCILQFSCFTKYNRMQSKHKQTKCEHSRRNSYRLQLFSRYHYSKSKNYLKRRYRIRHWIPMFIGTPCTIKGSVSVISSNPLCKEGTVRFTTSLWLINEGREIRVFILINVFKSPENYASVKCELNVGDHISKKSPIFYVQCCFQKLKFKSLFSAIFFLFTN